MPRAPGRRHGGGGQTARTRLTESRAGCLQRGRRARSSTRFPRSESPLKSLAEDRASSPFHTRQNQEATRRWQHGRSGSHPLRECSCFFPVVADPEGKLKDTIHVRGKIKVHAEGSHELHRHTDIRAFASLRRSSGDRKNWLAETGFERFAIGKLNIGHVCSADTRSGLRQLP